MSHLHIPDKTSGAFIQIDILVNGGPIVVAGAWDWDKSKRIPGLYALYLKRHGVRVGPFYADLSKAHDAMRKLLKAFPVTTWEQPLEWLARQASISDWLNKNLGYPLDLVGGTWVDEKGKIILPPRPQKPTDVPRAIDRKGD